MLIELSPAYSFKFARVLLSQPYVDPDALCPQLSDNNSIELIFWWFHALGVVVVLIKFIWRKYMNLPYIYGLECFSLDKLFNHLEDLKMNKATIFLQPWRIMPAFSPRNNFFHPGYFLFILLKD